MKFLSLGMVPAALALSSCGMMNAPLDGSGSFDPLRPPGSGMQGAPTSYGPDLSPGTFVTANIPNTAFYKNKPKGTEDADKLLSMGTNMKIVSNDSNYLKVELDSGEVGWVPSVMVASANPGADNYPIDGTYQVYPPLPGGTSIEPLPIIDPNGLPPEGAIPTIIDPDAPVPDPGTPIKIDPVPDLKPTEPEVKPEEVKPEETKPEGVKPAEGDAGKAAD
ncbi:hypothetical protein HZ994_14480 [Akkermansiaceae bacterium]|nr:hypothetical protein HZ994_14480 [Akkermansiaceae bacterium]